MRFDDAGVCNHGSHGLSRMTEAESMALQDARERAAFRRDWQAEEQSFNH